MFSHFKQKKMRCQFTYRFFQPSEFTGHRMENEIMAEFVRKLVNKLGPIATAFWRCRNS